MKPLEISIENCNELIPDERRRVLGSEARKFADGGMRPRLIWRFTGNYFHDVIKEHERIFWMDAFRKRKARLARINAKGA